MPVFNRLKDPHITRLHTVCEMCWKSEGNDVILSRKSNEFSCNMAIMVIH